MDGYGDGVIVTGVRNEFWQDQAVETLVARAAQMNLTVGRVKIVKLLYLADLRAVEESGQPFTGFVWRWKDHGPFDADFYGAARRLIQQNVVAHEPTDRYGVPEHLYHPTRRTRIHELDGHLRVIDAVLVEWGNYSASSLGDLSYQTPPMLEAQANGRGRGQVLNLAAGRAEDESDIFALAEALGDDGYAEPDPDVPKWRHEPDRPLLTLDRPLRAHRRRRHS